MCWQLSWGDTVTKKNRPLQTQHLHAARVEPSWPVTPPLSTDSKVWGRLGHKPNGRWPRWKRVKTAGIRSQLNQPTLLMLPPWAVWTDRCSSSWRHPPSPCQRQGNCVRRNRMFSAAAFQQGVLSKHSLYLDPSEGGLLVRCSALCKCVHNQETFLGKQAPTLKRNTCMLMSKTERSEEGRNGGPVEAEEEVDDVLWFMGEAVWLNVTALHLRFEGDFFFVFNFAVYSLLVVNPREHGAPSMPVSFLCVSLHPHLSNLHTELNIFLFLFWSAICVF